MNDLNKLAQRIHASNVAKGFYKDIDDLDAFLSSVNAPDNIVKTVKDALIGQRLMLIVSELAESLEGNRKDIKSNIYLFLEDEANGKHETKEGFMLSFETHIKDTQENEVVDAFIRIMDFVGKYEINLELLLSKTLKYNSLRAQKHGKSY